MQQVAVIDNSVVATVALEPTRARVLAELVEPGSATTLAERLGLPRQKLNDHVRALLKSADAAGEALPTLSIDTETRSGPRTSGRHSPATLPRQWPLSEPATTTRARRAVDGRASSCSPTPARRRTRPVLQHPADQEAT